jgi:hypothetical protein
MEVSLFPGDWFCLGAGGRLGHGSVQGGDEFASRQVRLAAHGCLLEVLQEYGQAAFEGCWPGVVEGHDMVSWRAQEAGRLDAGWEAGWVNMC